MNLNSIVELKIKGHTLKTQVTTQEVLFNLLVTLKIRFLLTIDRMHRTTLTKHIRKKNPSDEGFFFCSKFILI